MPTISTFLWFDDQARQAAEFYVSVFPNSRIVDDSTADGAGVVSFDLDGRPFSALNGGPVFTFTPATSFVVHCSDQGEVDYYWDRLTEGGQESRCGWLVDRFGVSWQVVPTAMFDLIGGPDEAGRGRAGEAMLTMTRIDLDALQAAYDGRG